MLKQEKWWIIVFLQTACLLICGLVVFLPLGHAATQDEKRSQETLTSAEDAEQHPETPDGKGSGDPAAETYLFIHDTSRNMRRKKRIPLMQDSMRQMLDALPETSNVGLQVFGHRFALDGPDACEDAEMLVPFEPLALNRDDFETHFNVLSDPPLGGGAAVGFSLQEAMKELRVYDGMKEIFLYMVDLQVCEEPDPIATIRSLCQIDDLHLTLIGIGLKQDFRTLQEENIEQLGCVDVLNLLTPEDVEELPEKLLTRLSVEFRNAEGERVDPRPGEQLTMKLFHRDARGKVEQVREKIKDASVRGSSFETVGLIDGTYLLELLYGGQSIRDRKELLVMPQQQTTEVIHLGRMLIDVRDSEGKLLEHPVERNVKITVTDSEKTIRTAANVAHAEFDLLPGTRYNVLISYNVGGEQQTVKYHKDITIQEGNHQPISITLPVGSLSGKVLDMQGNPARQVKMTLTATPSTTGEKLTERVTETDEQGNYVFADISEGTYTLTYQKAGYTRESQPITVVGGTIQNVDAIVLFHGLEIHVAGVSGTPVDDAKITLVHEPSQAQIPVNRHDKIYRNAQDILPGPYTITVEKPGYETASQHVVLESDMASLDVSFSLPYYIIVIANVVNGKEEPLPGANISFENLHTSLILPGENKRVLLNPDGTFEAKLRVAEKGKERLHITWTDLYNQQYVKETTFQLPQGPKTISLGQLRLPVNFLQLTLTDVNGRGILADKVEVYHHQSGQSSIQMNVGEAGVYESIALLDGDYTIKVLKKGCQARERIVSITDGQVKHVPLTLHNYMTVIGTVVDGKNNRISDAIVKFEEDNSTVISLQPIMTGKDGRFQATLLVRKAAPESVSVSWKSPASGKHYQFSTTFELSEHPMTEFFPQNLGLYQLAANFVRVEILDVSGRGLSGVEVEFISSQGEITRGVELGDGLYESLDLHDGTYSMTIMKPGYKENVIISDILVGKNQREVTLEPLTVPHYATVTGVVLNGHNEGVPNVAMTFSEKASEQLERCRTNPDGTFSTTLLITGTGEEQWQAFWKRKEYQTSGSFALPLHPKDTAHLGEIHLPANFVSIPVNDIRGNILTDVDVEVLHRDGTAVELEEFTLQEPEPGVYQAQNLPDGTYVIRFSKAGYEQGLSRNVSVSGGKHYRLSPVELGYYVTLKGTVVNGKLAPVAGAVVNLQQALSRIIPPEQPAQRQSEEAESNVSPAQEQNVPTPQIVTDTYGRFNVTVLVQSPGLERLTVTWNSNYILSQNINLSQGPETQEVDLKLPINFVTVRLTDIADKPLSDASIVLTHQVQKTSFSLQARESEKYHSAELPDGEYEVLIQKDQYETKKGLVTVRGGEVKEMAFHINHYVSIKGYVIDGKGDGVSAAIVTFHNLKLENSRKIISGTDGVFETQVLVKEIGKEMVEISYVGKNASYTKQFWLNLPAEPGQIVLPGETTRLPINYMTIEVKSVAATGVAGALVKLTHQETGKVIQARDNDNGNYEALELPNGTYDIVISKENYQTITIENMSVANGEHKSNILAPKFSHYITMSGVVRNGKNQGVSGAVVSIADPKRLTDCDPFTTRADGSFTLHALVTDVGSETLEVTWNEDYRTTLPVKLPSIPEHIRLENIKLPINFISVNVQDIYGKDITEAKVSFLKKQHQITVGQQMFTTVQTLALYTAREISNGLYESPPLPDNTYIIVVRKEGYVQKNYPEIPISSGETIDEALLQLPHLITLTGKVINGKGEGMPGVQVDFAQKNSQRSLYQLETDDSGAFSEQLLVTSPGKETLLLRKPYESSQLSDRFELTQDFSLLSYPGEQHFEELRLPINFIPIQVQNVAEQGLDDVEITLTLVTTESQSSTDEQIAMASKPLRPIPLGQGRYEARDLRDGTYSIRINKKGYQTQQRTVSVMSGEIAPEVVFILPHYVVVKGQVIDGKGDGVTNAVLEFEAQNSDLIENPGGGNPHSRSPISSVTTNPNGEFIARLLVNKMGDQGVRVSWDQGYVKQYFFTLPEQPQSNFKLDEEIQLPINFVPFCVTDVLGEAMAGVEIQLSKVGKQNETPPVFLARPLGSGYYEAQELQDGVYTMTIHKDGYQDVTGNFSVNGGEEMAEQTFSLPHYVTVEGTIVNSKGLGVQGAEISLAGLNSQVLQPVTTIKTDEHGNFLMDLLVTGAGSDDLQEHLEVTWTDEASSKFLPQAATFGVSHTFTLSNTPRVMNLGLLTLPANFLSVSVQDREGKGLAGVEVTFIDEQGREFPAHEMIGGLYEGQNLPDGTYNVIVEKEGYQTAQKSGIAIQSSQQRLTDAIKPPMTFQLPYYVDIKGTTVNGKGEALTSQVDLTLSGFHSKLVPNSLSFDQQGNFEATLLVNASGREQIDIHWDGDYGRHTRSVSFILPKTPQQVDLQRLNLPINFIPIEVKDLLGYGISGAQVRLSHITSGEEISAKELGDGYYEGQNLPNGSYQISAVKEGYKAIENVVATVSEGVVSDTKTFRLQHYVWITGKATNGEGEGVRDPFIEVERLRSIETSKQSDITGRFEMQLEVQEVGTERIYLTWKNTYRTPVIFNIPEKPEKKDLGEIRLPINFLSILTTDISGSVLQGVEVNIYNQASERIQTCKTDLNGFCKTYDLPNGIYQVSVEKAGYKKETREVQLRDGQSLALRFTLPHYVMVRGYVKDIMQNPVGDAEIIFEEFTDDNDQKLRTSTDPETGKFEQRLLVNNATFLERQKGHFGISKGDISQIYTFKIPAIPNQTITYNALLFPINYLSGKVVDADIKTVPLENADIALTPIPDQPLVMTGRLPVSEKELPSQEALHLTTDSLGRFKIGNLQQREYKITIQKEGYVLHEDFIRISGLLQEQEFALEKE